MTKEETKSIDETINTLQDQIMYLSHEIVEKLISIRCQK